jgi:polysaccharide export outer membrane protein
LSANIFEKRTVWLRGVCCALLIVAAGEFPAVACAASPATDTSLRPVNPVEYRIGPLDTLSITVFEVKVLSFDTIHVDASGQLVLPLIGVVTAQGKTARELSEDIARRLDATYMHDPQVSVAVVDSPSEKVTVEGDVTNAGVFKLPGGDGTLLEAIAMAQGVTPLADLKHISIFRTVGGTQQRLVFDGSAVQEGRVSDPGVLAGDVVVVGESASKRRMQGLIKLAPLFETIAILHP